MNESYKNKKMRSFGYYRYLSFPNTYIPINFMNAGPMNTNYREKRILWEYPLFLLNVLLNGSRSGHHFMI